MNTILYILLLWIVPGILGFILRCFNKATIPNKAGLKALALATHLFFGPIALLYGYLCFAGRKYNTVKV